MTSIALEPMLSEKQALRWVRYPTVYEINVCIWLSEVSRRCGRSVDLSSVPANEWDAIASFGFDAVWLMGVWERSPAGISIANNNQSLLNDFRRALPDFRPEDNIGSPYCVRSYSVDQQFGGPAGLACARRELAARGMKLILDFVPNHVAPDHGWTTSHPEYFIHGTAEEAQSQPSAYIKVGEQVYACGRDPFFPAWPDVLQLDAFHPGLRTAAIETIATIAQQCDGIRCDMAMLLVNNVFERTWGARAGRQPTTEYWVDVIANIKARNPGFIFIAEAYWDMEWALQQQGFDFCYDKKLYDRLEHSDAENVRLHLCADMSYQDKLVRFIENHDEPRAAQTFAPAKHRAVAVAIATLPGMKLFYDGQFDGKHVRLPVFLGRLPEESIDPHLAPFYSTLLATATQPVFSEGTWQLCERSGWADNATYRNLVAWTWIKGGNRYLVAVNLSDRRSQAQIQIPWSDTGAHNWRVTDVFSGSVYDRSGHDMVSPGLYIELEGWGFHLFRCEALKAA